jgi:hypothetical protein
MDFINKSIKTIGNAVEINTLKSDRDELRKKKEQYVNKLKKYTLLVDMKNTIQNNINSNEATLNSIRQYFVILNIDKDIKLTKEEFYIKYPNSSDIVSLFNLYNTTNNTKLEFINTLEEINKETSVSQEVYQQKIDEIDNELKKVNTKLDKVREKQFGKSK